MKRKPLKRNFLPRTSNAIYAMVVVAIALFSSPGHVQVIPLHPSLYQRDEVGATDKGSLVFLDKYVAGKRVVFLGEDDHLVSEFNTLKTSIVEYLAECHGFSAVLFESRDGTAFWDMRVDSSDLFENLYRTGAVIVPWLVEENRSLFLRATKQRREMEMGGIDIFTIALKMRSDSAYRAKPIFEHLRAAAYLTPAQKKTFAEIDSDARAVIKMRDSIYKVTDLYGGTRVEYADTPAYRAWIGTLRDIRQRYITLATTFAAPVTTDERLLDRIIRIRAAVIQTFIDPACESRYRDSVMAANLAYYLSVVAPQSKVIVWAHDGHIAKRTFSPTYESSIGRYLADSTKEQSFFLSIKHGGRRMANGMDTMKNFSADSKTIEPDLSRLGKAFFLDLRSKTAKRDLRRQYSHAYFESIRYYPYPNVYRPAQLFDAVIYLHRTHRPHYAVETIRAFYEKNFP